jgi:hypothetical protein
LPEISKKSGAHVKSIFRLIGLALTVSGWAVAALCLHVIRTPNPSDPSQSKLVVIPKARLGLTDTYVDARHWTLADVPDHKALIWRVLDAGQAEQLKYLTDPKSGSDVQTQLTDALTGDHARNSRTPSTGTKYDRDSSDRAANTWAGIDLSGLLNLPVSF